RSGVPVSSPVSVSPASSSAEGASSPEHPTTSPAVSKQALALVNHARRMAIRIAPERGQASDEFRGCSRGIEFEWASSTCPDVSLRPARIAGSAELLGQQRGGQLGRVANANRAAAQLDVDLADAVEAAQRSVDVGDAAAAAHAGDDQRGVLHALPTRRSLGHYSGVILA